MGDADALCTDKRFDEVSLDRGMEPSRPFGLSNLHKERKGVFAYLLPNGINGEMSTIRFL